MANSYSLKKRSKRRNNPTRIMYCDNDTCPRIKVRREVCPFANARSMFKENLLAGKRAYYSGEISWFVRSEILTILISFLSYYSIFYGPLDYDLLHDHETDTVFPHKAFVKVNFGYSLSYSIIYLAFACMHMISVIQKNPDWSIPILIIFINNVITDANNIIPAIALFFEYLPWTTAMNYCAGVLFVICVEFWLCLGAIRFYKKQKIEEYRSTNDEDGRPTYKINQYKL